MKPFALIRTIIEALLIAFVVFIAASLVLTKLNTPIQYRVYSVLSGSMQPTIATGSLVVTVPQGEYQKGDIVTYRQTGAKEAVTHRVVEVSRDEDLGITSYRTQGDANNAPDPELVRDNRVIGKVLAHVPFLGYPVGFAQTQTGFIALVIIPASLIVYSELMTAKNETVKAVSGWKAKRAEAKRQAEVEAEPKAEKPKKKQKPKSKTKKRKIPKR